MPVTIVADELLLLFQLGGGNRDPIQCAVWAQEFVCAADAGRAVLPTEKVNRLRRDCACLQLIVTAPSPRTRFEFRRRADCKTHFNRQDG